MLYLSQILARPIFDAEGERIAQIKDVIVRYGEEDYPPVLGLVARYRRRLFFMPRSKIASFNESGARMNSGTIDLKPFTR
ncbi:MAG TPA: PRC-barrel domain-containing protein, partial [Pyrinomonadaceae bacterium]